MYFRAVPFVFMIIKIRNSDPFAFAESEKSVRVPGVVSLEFCHVVAVVLLVTVEDLPVWCELVIGAVFRHHWQDAAAYIYIYVYIYKSQRQFKPTRIGAVLLYNYFCIAHSDTMLILPGQASMIFEE